MDLINGVVVLTYNALKQCNDIFRQNLAILNSSLDKYHILIIDSSSTDGTWELLQQHNFQLIQILPSEFNHGTTRQLAVELLPKAELIAYLTQDVLLESIVSLDKLFEAFDDPSVGTAFGRQLPHIDADFFATQNRLFNYPNKSYQRTYDDKALYGIKCIFSSDSFAAYRCQALDKVRGFPNNTIVSEDMYVAALMLKDGYKIAYVADARCYHSHNYSTCQEFKRYFDIGVFFACEPWIKVEFGSAEGEGKKAVIHLFKKTIKYKPWLIVNFIIRLVMRIIGFKLGKNYQKLPKSLIIKFTAQKQFWK